MRTKQLALSFYPSVSLDSRIVTPSDSRWRETIEQWQASTRFGYDLETFPKRDRKTKGKKKVAGDEDELRPWNGLVRIITIGLDTNRCLLIDLGGEEKERLARFEKLEQIGFWAILKERLENANVMKVGHNLKYDFVWTRYNFGIVANGCRDTELASRLMWAGLPTNGVLAHSLKAVTFRCLGNVLDKTEQRSDWGFDLTNEQLNYAAADSLIVLPLCDALEQLLKQTDTDEGCRIEANWWIECAAVPAFAEMELSGMPVNVEKLDALLATYRSSVEVVLEPFRDEFPGINPDSTDQIVPAVRDKYGIDLLDKDDKPSTAKDIVSQHWDKPALKALSLARTLQTYIVALENVQRNTREGRARSSFQLIGGKAFGRCTSSEPNLQQLPNPFTMPAALRKLIPKARTVFEVPEGQALIVSDLKTAHGTIACEASTRAFGDNLLYRALLTYDDIHSHTAANLPKVKAKGFDVNDVKRLIKSAKVREKANEPLTDDEVLATESRQKGKAVFFGSLNCQWADTLRDCLRVQSDEDVSKAEAIEMIRGWEQTYPELKRFQDKLVDDASRTMHNFADILPEPYSKIWYGRVIGLSGRRIYLEKSKRQGTYQVKRQDAAAFYWTSTEASIAKVWAAGVFNEFRAHPEWNAVLGNIAHDEINATCDWEYRNEVAACVFKWKLAAMRMWCRLVPVSEKEERPEDSICTNWAQK